MLVEARPVRWLSRVAPALLLVGVAFAQGTPPGSTGGEQSADLPFAKDAKLTPQETLDQSKTYVTKMQGILSGMLKLQDEAQKTKDVIKLNCINDKIEQVRGHMAVTDKSMGALGDAIAKGDDGARQHEFTRITILYQKVEVLNGEAQACVGEDITTVAPQEVTVEIDPSIPQEDPTEVPVPPLEPLPRPTEASPTT